MSEAIHVVVNGKKRELAESATLLDLLAALELDPRTVAVELNKRIVRRAALGETMLKNEDRIELVHFVGGG